jgi:ubiquitin conjugation factor E4 B
MMNDATYLLDEPLSKVRGIKKPQNESSSRDPRTTELWSLEANATALVSLGKVAVDILKKLSSETKNAFTTSKILDRFTATLCYNLAESRYQYFSLWYPDKCGFTSEQLFSAILQIFLNLLTVPAFIKALAKEGRYFTRSLINRTANFAKSQGLLSEAEKQQLYLLLIQVNHQRMTMVVEEEVEVPDEFLGKHILERSLGDLHHTWL